MARNNRTKPKRNGQLSKIDPNNIAGFRRLIHIKGDIGAGISKNRKLLHVESIKPTIDFLFQNQIYKNVVAANAFPEKYSSIKSGRRFARAEDHLEILWTSAVVSHYAVQINSFLDLKNRFSENFLRSNFVASREILNYIDKSHGKSIWLLSLQLITTQYIGGFTAQKQLLDEVIRTDGLDSLTAYLAYLFSYSVEDGISIDDIDRDFLHSKDEVLDPFYQYLQFHVNPFDLAKIENPTNCIYNENDSSIIDRYETLIECLQLFYFKGLHLEILNMAISWLSEISDPRISNLAFLLGQSSTVSSDPQFLEACENYTKGDYLAAEQISRQIETDHPNSIWIGELSARIASYTDRQFDNSTLSSEIIGKMKAYIDVTTDIPKSKTDLQRLGFVTRKLPACRMIASILDRSVELAVTKNFTVNDAVFALSSPLIQPQNFSIFNSLQAHALSTIKDSGKSYENLVSFRIHQACCSATAEAAESIGKLDIPEYRVRLYQSFALYNAERYLEASGKLKEYEEILKSAVKPRIFSYQYALNRQLGQVREALQSFTNAYLQNKHSYALYPIPEFCKWAINHAQVDEYSVHRAILLHAYSKYYDSIHDGDISDAFEDILEYYEIDFPSELISLDIPRKELVYILRYIATIERLEDTVAYEGVEAIEAERIKLLQWLVTNDPTERASYTEEVSVITKEQAVARMSAQLDRSKIYVHEEGARRVLRSKLSVSFSRYRQLLNDPSIEFKLETIEQALRKLLKESDSGIRNIIIPSSERDSLFFNMVQMAFETIVLDPAHGFKTYLSTRILHGILEGELRASFVNAGLLVASDSPDKSGDVERELKEVISVLSRQDADALTSAVVRFSDKVQELIAKLKDRRIRVYSKELPDALFAVSLTETALEKLQNSVTATTSLSEFIDRVFSAFWESMESCLLEVRVELNTTFRRSIKSAFDQLEVSLASIAFKPGMGTILDSIATSRVSFSNDLDRISSWFVRGGKLSDEPFALDIATRVASQIVNNCYPTHQVSPHLEISPDVEFDGSILNPMVDMLTNCFQNAAEHAGFEGTGPEINVIFTLLPDGCARITVRNPLHPSIDVNYVRREIDVLLSEDDLVTPVEVGEEGRTGIRKMKRILKFDLGVDQPLSIITKDDQSVELSFALTPGNFNVRTYH